MDGCRFDNGTVIFPYKDNEKITQKIHSLLESILYYSGYNITEKYFYYYLSTYIYKICTKNRNFSTSYLYGIAIASLIISVKMWCDIQRVNIKFINETFIYPKPQREKYIWFENFVLDEIGWNILEKTYECFFLKTRDNLIKELQFMTSHKFIKPRFRVASFDIGKENFAEWVEEADSFKIENLRTRYNLLPRKLKRKSAGPIYPEIQEILDELVLSCRRIHMGVYDIRHTKQDILEIETRENLYKHLEEHRYVWDTCDLFLIEQQFVSFAGFGRGAKKGAKANIDALKLAECLFTWLKIAYPERQIFFFSAKFKTKVFTDIPLKKKEERKNFTVEKSLEAAKLRGDTFIIELYQVFDELYRKQVPDKKRKYYHEKFKHYNEEQKYMLNKVLDKQKFNDFTDAELQARAAIYKYYIAEF